MYRYYNIQCDICQYNEGEFLYDKWQQTMVLCKKECDSGESFKEQNIYTIENLI